MPKPIAYEESILAALTAKGYSGGVEPLRKLASQGERLRRRYENECSYEWANTPDYEAGTERAEKRLLATATAAGLTLYIQGDCRGATAYVDMEPIPDNNYTRAFCLYPGGR